MALIIDAYSKLLISGILIVSIMRRLENQLILLGQLIGKPAQYLPCSMAYKKSFYSRIV
jgi:hypothetical protein